MDFSRCDRHKGMGISYCNLCEVEQLRETEDRLEARIKELEEGACRYNCRTAKEAFMAGFEAGYSEGFWTEENPAHWEDDCFDSPESHYEKWTNARDTD